MRGAFLTRIENGPHKQDHVVFAVMNGAVKFKTEVRKRDSSELVTT